MTYLRDGDAFTLAFGGAPEPGLVAVGWLDAGKPFARGDVPRERVDRLRQTCRNGVNRTRGLYRCPLCPRADGAALPPPTTVHSDAGDYPVGGAEIRVVGPSGTRYAAPDMIIHYVEEHGYAPPEDFLEGL